MGKNDKSFIVVILEFVAAPASSNGCSGCGIVVAFWIVGGLLCVFANGKTEGIGFVGGFICLIAIYATVGAIKGK